MKIERVAATTIMTLDSDEAVALIARLAQSLSHGEQRYPGGSVVKQYTQVDPEALVQIRVQG